MTLLVAAFALLVPVTVASAQDPGYDQYAPTPATGGNQNPAPNETPVPQSGTDNSGGPTGTTDTDTGGTTVSPTDTTSTDTTDTGTAGGGNNHADKSGNKDDRTLDGLAASAANDRNARKGNVQAAQLSSASGGESGIGVLLWIALALIVLWAAVYGFRQFRGRDGDSRDTFSGRTGEGRA